MALIIGVVVPVMFLKDRASIVVLGCVMIAAIWGIYWILLRVVAASSDTGPNDSPEN